MQTTNEFGHIQPSPFEASSRDKENGSPFKTPDRQEDCTQPSYNPFEVDIHSLSLPACSPSVFSSTKNRTPEKGEMNDSFRWSIGQVAKIKPAKIDEASQQTTLDGWNSDQESRAQKAIESFFLQNSVCPSPWGGSMAFKHVSFSPNLASTAYFSKSNSSFSVYRKNDSSSTEPVGKKDAWTQTMLAIPKDMDLFQLLGHFFSFLEDQNDQNLDVACEEEGEVSIDVKEMLSTSNLRRKLFSPNRLRNTDTTECGPVPLSISPLMFCTPEKQLAVKLEPIPNSAGTYFSSSPISDKNCSFSSSLVGQHRSSPPVSPILIQDKKSSRIKSFAESAGADSISPTKFISSTYCESNNNHLKSILKGSSAEQYCDNASKRTSAILSVSMASESCNEENDGDHSQDINMDAEIAKSCESVQSNSMQISGVQYSIDEEALNEITEISAFNPSLLSQDTGFQTKSYQSSLETTDFINSKHKANVEFKEKMLQNWLSQSRDCQQMDSALEITSDMCSNQRGNAQDSLSTSTWKPKVFSTPH